MTRQNGSRKQKTKQKTADVTYMYLWTLFFIDYTTEENEIVYTFSQTLQKCFVAN